MAAVPAPVRRGVAAAASVLALAGVILPVASHVGASTGPTPTVAPASPHIVAPAAGSIPAVDTPAPQPDGAARAAAGSVTRGRVDDEKAVRKRAVAGAKEKAAAPPAPAGRGPTVALSRSTATLFASPRGDDGNPGTEAAPVRSLTRAAGMARPGTRVVVAPGTYTGSVTTTASGTPSARIAFVSATRGAARITGTGGGVAWRNSGDYVDIVGFDITGPNEDGLTDEGSFVRLVDNRVHGFRSGNCITTANNGYDLHDIDVIGNMAFSCGGDSLDHGIYVSHVRGVVANNIAFGNAGFGIHCWHACNALTISNNLVFDNPQGGIVIGQGDNPNFGEVAANGFVVSNNIAVGNGRDGIRESGATGQRNRFLNNLLWNNGANDINLNTGSESGTLVENPRLGDLRPDGTGDYRPRAGSPALGAGVHDGAPSTDIDGRPRPATGVDLGAYQR